MTEPTEPPGRSAVQSVVDEPPLPSRIRRPLDGLWLLIFIAGMTALVAMSIIAERTMTAITADLADLNNRVPEGPLEIVSFTADLAGVAMPPILVVVLMIRGRVRTTVELLIAGLIAAAAASLVSTWLRTSAPARLHDPLVPVIDGVDGTPVPPYPAMLVALVTIVSRRDLKRSRQVAIFAIAGSFAVGLLRGEATVGGLLIALAIGASAGLAVRLFGGQPSVAPSGQQIVATLAENGYHVEALYADPSGEYRLLTAETPHGRLSVLIVDRDDEGAGTLGRLMDRLRTRADVLPRQTVTMRETLDRIALQSLAVARAGARTPPLRNVLRVDGDSAIIVFDHVEARPLAEMSADEISEHTLEDLWRHRIRKRPVRRLPSLCTSFTSRGAKTITS